MGSRVCGCALYSTVLDICIPGSTKTANGKFGFRYKPEQRAFEIDRCFDLAEESQGEPRSEALWMGEFLWDLRIVNLTLYKHRNLHCLPWLWR